MSFRADYIHCARVYLAEARRRKGNFGFLLLTWAGNARRLAAREPVQKGLL
jgi:hypothetical protein